MLFNIFTQRSDNASSAKVVIDVLSLILSVTIDITATVTVIILVANTKPDVFSNLELVPSSEAEKIAKVEVRSSQHLVLCFVLYTYQESSFSLRAVLLCFNSKTTVASVQ